MIDNLPVYVPLVGKVDWIKNDSELKQVRIFVLFIVLELYVIYAWWLSLWIDIVFKVVVLNWLVTTLLGVAYQIPTYQIFNNS